MQKVYLPDKFKPLYISNLKRLGRDSDGGYLIDQVSLDNSNNLITIGLGLDFSFEKDFIKINKKNTVTIFDATVSFKMLILNSIKNIIFLIQNKRNVEKIRYIFFPINFYFSKVFFNIKHIKKNIGSNSNHHLSLGNILKNKKNIILKIDIDNDEYYMLDEIINNQDKINCLIIEFHMVPLFINIIGKFIDRLKLKLVHVHANNNGGFNKDRIPLIIEMTFSRNKTAEKSDGKVSNPHNLDKSCNKFLQDYSIKYV